MWTNGAVKQQLINEVELQSTCAISERSLTIGLTCRKLRTRFPRAIVDVPQIWVYLKLSSPRLLVVHTTRPCERKYCRSARQVLKMSMPLKRSHAHAPCQAWCMDGRVCRFAKYLRTENDYFISLVDVFWHALSSKCALWGCAWMNKGAFCKVKAYVRRFHSVGVPFENTGEADGLPAPFGLCAKRVTLTEKCIYCSCKLCFIIILSILLMLNSWAEYFLLCSFVVRMPQTFFQVIFF